MAKTRNERVLEQKKEDKAVVGRGYIALNELTEGQHTVLIIPGKGPFIVYKIQGEFHHTRLYKGAPQ